MFDYLVRRTAIAGITLLLITFVVFGLIRNMPGNPLMVQMENMDPSKQINPQDYERMRKSYGLDKPWHIAYFQWLGNLARLDLGRSIFEKQPVTRMILERMGPTLLLSVTSLGIAYLLSIPIGLTASARAGKLDERIISVILYMLYSLPTFVAALLLLILFYVKFDRFLPAGGMTSDNYALLSFPEKVLDILRHALLPIICYTYGSLAYYSRFIRANMQEVIRQDYVRTARAKGVSPFRVIVRHAFRNTFIPLVTLIGLMLPGLLGGSVIIEQIFTWPGMGRLFFESIGRRDYPVIMGLTLMFSVLTLAGQLLADLLYAVVDPRVTLK